MSQEVGIIVVIQPAPGKVERLKEVLRQTGEWIKANEPGTLAFTFYEEHREDGVKLFMYERYASQDALDKHEGSNNYKQVFELMTNEELLAGTPSITKGQHFGGFSR